MRAGEHRQVRSAPDPRNEGGRGRALAIDDIDVECGAAILVGAVAKDKLVEIAQIMRARRQKVDDPKLQEILDEIELRAEVEIAKLTRGD